MWVGVTLAVLVEVIPSPLRTIGVAVYLFIISNIGGNMPLLVPPLQTAFENLGIGHVDALRCEILPSLMFMFFEKKLYFNCDMNLFYEKIHIPVDHVP